MSEGKCFTLNPLANTFVPGKTKEPNTITEINIAKTIEAIVKKIIKKEVNGESFTQMEIAGILSELIILKHKNSAGVDLSKLNSYLSEKIPLLEKLQNEHRLTSKVAKNFFDSSKFSPPPLPFLLVFYFGLYRHEQAERPLLSLSCRSEIVINKTWSMQSSDKLLWNPSCVISVCQCPPMFGYSVPPNCFGNPLKISYSCSEPSVHLNHYLESSEGNEFILTNNFNSNIPDEPPFIDYFENKVNIKVEDLSLQFVNIINGLCNFLAAYTGVLEDCLEDDMDLIEEVTFDEEPVDYPDTLITDGNQKAISSWEDCTMPVIHMETLYGECLDDSDHPLLEVENYDPDEGVSKEIEEMIRRSLSPKKVEDPCLTVEFEDVEPTEAVICDPPCSIWCNNACKDKDSAETEEIKVSQESISTGDMQQTNLLAPELEPKTETFPAIDLKSALYLSSNEQPKRSFRRSLSVNDCDPYYYGSRYDSTAMKGLASSSELFIFKFSGKNTGNLQQYNRSNSWKDTDSGFVSHSSQDDLFEKDYREQDEIGSMWGLFSGEDSLWKPLPNCFAQNRTDDKQVTHKRVRDLRRQRSLN